MSKVAIKLKKSMAGPGVNWPSGSTQLVEKGEAERLVEADYAEYAEGKEPSTKRSTRKKK